MIASPRPLVRGRGDCEMKGARTKGQALNCDASPQFVERTVRMAEVDMELVADPVGPRNVAVPITGTRTERNRDEVEMTSARLPLIPQLEQYALEEGDSRDLLPLQGVGGEILHLFVCRDAIAEPLGVGRGRTAIVRQNRAVEIIARGGVGSTLAEPPLTGRPGLVVADARSDHDHPTEAGLLRGEREAGEVHLEVEDLMVEPLPLRRPAALGLGRDRSRAGCVEDGDEVRISHDELREAQDVHGVTDIVHDHLADGNPDAPEARPHIFFFATAHGTVLSKYIRY